MSRSNGISIGDALAGLSHNISNLFGTVQSRERRETERLYRDTRQAFKGSVCDRTERMDLALHIMQETLERSGRTDAPRPLSLAICMAADDFIEGDGLLDFPDEPDAALSAEAGVYLRNDLRHRQGVLARGEEGLIRWAELVANTFAGILDYLPPNIAIADVSEEEGASGIRVALVDLLESPAEAIERILITWISRTGTDAELYNPALAEQLLGNVRLASGVDPTDADSKRRLVLPTEAKCETPRDLVDRYLAHTPFSVLLHETVPIQVPEETWSEHCHILGGTGHGKTQLLQKLIYENLPAVAAGQRSVVVIDSHGDLIDTLTHLECFAPDAAGGLADRLVIIDPTDVEHPPALNLFDANLKRVAGYGPADRERIMAGTIELYEYLFRSVFGAELTQKQGVVFSYLARLMLSIPGATIVTLRDLLENGEPFKPYMARLDGSARHFFESEFFDRSFSATKQQLRRRLWGVFATPALERVFAHPTTKIDLFAALNRGSVVLINTAKDFLKQTGCEVLGRFSIAMLGQAALERATIPPEQRTPTLVFVDEAHDYVDEQVDAILTQARKYRVGLVLAHQTLDQLTPKLRSTIAANTSIKFAGGLAAKDARAVAEDMRTTPSFIQATRKRTGSTEFASFIKNATPHALRVTVPLGMVEARGRLSEDEYTTLRERNRERYCWDATEAPAPRRQLPTAPEAAISTPAVPREAGRPTERKEAVKETRAGDIVARPPTAAGFTPPEGRQHTYLQNLIRKLAQDRGFRVTVEEPILAGTGRVDLSLDRAGERIAFEVSVSTSPDHELGNVLKCFAAGFHRVCVVSASARHLAAIEREATKRLTDSQRAQTMFLLPDEVAAFLDASGNQAEPSEQTIRGYRVKVARKDVSNAESRARREAINQIIAQSVRSMREGPKGT